MIIVLTDNDLPEPVRAMDLRHLDYAHLTLSMQQIREAHLIALVRPLQAWIVKNRPSGPSGIIPLADFAHVLADALHDDMVRAEMRHAINLGMPVSGRFSVNEVADVRDDEET